MATIKQRLNRLENARHPLAVNFKIMIQNKGETDLECINRHGHDPNDKRMNYVHIKQYDD